MNRDTLIQLERELRGKAGVSVIRAHLRAQTHAMLAAEARLRPLVLKPEWRVKDA